METLSHLTQITGYLSSERRGITAFRFHYNDRPAEPRQIPFEGLDVPFLIDGPGGERICGLKVLWSDQTQHTGVIVGVCFISLYKKSIRENLANICK